MYVFAQPLKMPEEFSFQESDALPADPMEMHYGIFDQAIHSITALFGNFQKEPTLGRKTEVLPKIYRELTLLRNAALDDHRAVVATEQPLDKKGEIKELRRGRVLEAQVESVMQLVTLLLDGELQLQYSIHGPHEKISLRTFYDEAKKVLAVSSPLEQQGREWDLAKYLYEENRLIEALDILKKLPLPDQLQKPFASCVSFPTKQKLDHFFQIAEQFSVREFLQKTSPEIWQPKTFLNVLSCPEVMEIFLRHVNPVTLMRLNRSCHELAKLKLSYKYALSQTKRKVDFQLFSLKTAPYICRKVLPIVVMSLYKNALEYKHLDPELQNDVGIVKIALFSILKKHNKSDYKKLLSFFPQAIQEHVPEYLSEIKATFGKRPVALQSFTLTGDTTYFKALAKAFICTFPNDKDICRIMVRIDGLLLAEASKQIKADPEIVFSAMQENLYAFLLASGKLIYTPEIVRSVVKNLDLFFHARTELKDDETIVWAAIEQNGQALAFASKKLRDTESFVMLALQKKSNILMDVSPRLQDNEIVVETAVSEHGLSLKYASERLKDNEKIVWAAIRQNVRAFEFASPRLQDNDTLALFAINQAGDLLRYASDRLKDDEAFVRAAVSVNGSALAFASDRLKDTEAIVKVATKIERRNINYASIRLQMLINS